jgi:hypothetical protein
MLAPCTALSCHISHRQRRRGPQDDAVKPVRRGLASVASGSANRVSPILQVINRGLPDVRYYLVVSQPHRALFRFLPVAAPGTPSISPQTYLRVMISKNQTIRRPQSLVQRFRKVVLVELPIWQLLILAIIIGFLWAGSIFDWDFVAGSHAFWRFPRGNIGGGENDMAAPLAAYFYYVQSPWHLPLFYVSALGAPAGVNVIFTDFVPIVPLIGKLIHSITGAVVNLYGAYFFLCFILPGVMMTLVLIAAKIRYALAAILGAVFADTAPVLLWRWGHVSLTAQFLLIGALALYLFSVQKRAWRGPSVAWIAFLILAYLTNIYLFAMLGTVWLCTVIQRRLDGLSKTQEVFATAALTVAVMLTVIALGGQFSPGSPLPFSPEYGNFSMNLLSPFAPQQSGLLPGLGGVIDATGGQYEGFNYLGLGLLLASLLVLPFEVSWFRRNLNRHVALFVAFVALTAFAISNRAFAGHWLLFELPMPHIHRVLGIFRSSGRFFWLICYTQMAIVIVLGFRRARPTVAVCLAAASIVQLFDVQPLREQIIASIADGPGPAKLDPGEVAHLVAGARHLEVVPSFQCSDGARDMQANAELMLAAARANVPTNTVYLARYTYGLTLRDLLREPTRADEMLIARRNEYCKQEIERARSGRDPGHVVVLLSDQPRPEDMVPGVTCSPLSWARYCQRSKSLARTIGHGWIAPAGSTRPPQHVA